MRINAIQNQIQPNQLLTKKVSKRNEPVLQPEPTEPAFKGAKGAFKGLCGGYMAGILIFVGGAISAGAALPAIAACAGIIGCGAAGAAAGNKIEDKVDNIIEKHRRNKN